jgi:hypothetical protein
VELQKARHALRNALEAYKTERNENTSLNEHYRRDRELDLVRDEVLDLSDKFDFFIVSCLRSGLIKPTGSQHGDALMSFTSQFGGVHDKNNEDPEALKKAFEAYKQNAIESDLGGRSKIR